MRGGETWGELLRWKARCREGRGVESGDTFQGDTRGWPLAEAAWWEMNLQEKAGWN